MGRRARLARLSLLSGLLILTIVVAVIHFHGRRVRRATEAWIGSQLQLIANSYLQPTLAFQDLEYNYPLTVRVRKLKLTAQDPTNPTKPVEILGAEEAFITLAEVPAIGQPVRIAKIVLNKPLFQAVAESPDSPQFIGFSKLIRGEATQPTTITTAAQAAAAALPKLSEYFQIRLIQLIDGRIVYDPRIPGTQPMELDQINTRLDITPTGNGGTYTLNTAITRKPVFTLGINGTLDLDRFAINDSTIILNADLSEKNRNYLPPQFQQLLSQYEVTGTLVTTLTGSFPLADIEKGNAKANLTLTNANLVLGEYRVPIKSMNLAARIESGREVAYTADVTALRGLAHVEGTTALTPLLDTTLNLSVKNMFLEDTLVMRPATAPTTSESGPAYAGRLNADAKILVPAALFLARAAATATTQQAIPPLPTHWGDGTVHLDHARLVKLPVIGELTRVLASGQHFLTGGTSRPSAPNETARAAFDLSRDTAILRNMTYTSPMIAARGAGTITLDEQLDLRVNGGPAEKVEALLGQHLGGTLAKITDAIASYHVTGTMHDPKVILDIHDEHLTGAVGAGVNRAGQGVKDLLDALRKDRSSTSRAD